MNEQIVMARHKVSCCLNFLHQSLSSSSSSSSVETPRERRCKNLNDSLDTFHKIECDYCDKLFKASLPSSLFFSVDALVVLPTFKKLY